MSNPRVKRPFAGASSDPTQRQITSFFNVQPSCGASRAEDVRSPLLPASVQANLLSVGMRVRKSVPEGYKVNDTSAFKLWTDSTVPSSTPRTSIVRSAPRELLPFCGINRIGGLDTQPEVEREDDFDAVPNLEDVPGLTMSQESADSAVESSHNRKRIFVDDVDDPPNPVQRWIFDADEGVSPRSLMPTGWGNARPIAIPRSRAAKKNTAAAVKDDVGQENMLVDEDFEEASFLVYGDGMDTTG